ncbi:hypothetical protein [Streptomyces sp. NPDC008122]|uniref:hypothetical protein n=1 Tax=Streptomyces sp. NPDC008122 TaxID=3364810 RepID=UPI0036DFAEAE
MLHRMLAASAAAACLLGVGTVQANAATAAPVARTQADLPPGCGTGGELEGFRQQIVRRAYSETRLIWNYCAVDKKATGMAFDINGGKVNAVWIDKAATGPNPTSWTGPYGKKLRTTFSFVGTSSVAYGSDWMRTCSDVTTPAGTHVVECTNWYQPSTMFKPVPD